MSAQPIWFDEPLVLADTEVCFCRFIGDRADASECPLHGVTREPAVKLAGMTGPDCCPF